MRSGRLGQRILRFSVPFFAWTVVAYFVYHSTLSDSGFTAWPRLDSRISEAEAQLQQIVAQRQHLENRVSALDPFVVDPDMIEEQGRRLLNFGHRNDLLIILPDS